MTFVLVFLGVMLAVIASDIGFSAGWQWDVLQGLGYCAVAMWIYLIIDTGKSSLKAHRVLGLMSLGCAAGHVLGLLLLDATLWHYLATDGPGHMQMAGLAFFLIVVIVILAWPSTRRWWHSGFNQFQGWHKWLAWTAMAVVAWHIYESGVYLGTIGFSMIVAFGLAAIAFHWKNRQFSPGFTMIHLWAVPIGLFMFVGLRQI